MAHERTVSANLKSHLAQSVTTIALCYKIVRQDSTIEGYTLHDNVITYDGVNYSPLGSGYPSDYKSSSDMSISNMDIEVLFNSNKITAEKLRAGIYDNAEVYTFKINYASVADGIIKLAYGRLGEREIRANKARIEVRGLTQLLSTPVGIIMTPECRVNLGHAKCTVTASTFAGAVTSINTQYKTFVDSAMTTYIDDYFSYGKIVWTGGLNSGFTLQVENYSTTGTFDLFTQTPYAIQVGDTFEAHEGCDRRFETCKARFNNVLNFRGYPHLPGLTKVMVIPADRSWTEDS